MQNQWKTIPENEYRTTDAVGSSELKDVLRSPRHFKERKNEDSPAFAFGRAFHALILEPDSNSVVELPELDLRTKKGREERDAILLGNPSATTVSASEMRTLREMQKAVLGHPKVKQILKEGVAEEAGFATCNLTGVQRRIKPDWRRKSRIIVDFKTCENASPEEFARDAVKFKYPLQASYYLDTANLIGGDYDSWLWVCVEKKWPHEIAIYQMDENGYALGRSQYVKALKLYSEAKETGIWMGYPQTIEILKMPAWAMANVDSEI